VGDEVGQAAIFSMAPTILHRMQFRGIGRQRCDRDACARDMFEETRGFLVPSAAIPDDQQWTLQMPPEVPDKRNDIAPGDVGGRQRKIESQPLRHGRDGEGAGDGQAVVAIPTRMERGLALRAHVRRTVGCSLKPLCSITTIVRPSHRAFFLGWQNQLE
jgi:hypothetical protein